MLYHSTVFCLLDFILMASRVFAFLRNCIISESTCKLLHYLLQQTNSQPEEIFCFTIPAIGFKYLVSFLCLAQELPCATLIFGRT